MRNKNKNKKKNKGGRVIKGTLPRTVNIQAMIEQPIADALQKLRGEQAREGRVSDTSSVVRRMLIAELENKGLLNRGEFL